MAYNFKGEPHQIKEKYQSFEMIRKGHIIHLVLSRPEELNSTDLQFYDDYNHFFTAVNYERDVRCIVLTAKGKHFCAGLDRKLYLEQSRKRHRP